MRRSTITVLAAGYYIAVVYLTGLSHNLTSMSQFFGHVLIYASAVGLISSLLFVAENYSSKKKEEEFCADTIAEIQNPRMKQNPPNEIITAQRASRVADC
jgi:predicted transporter